MTSPASCVCEPQRIVGGCAICNGVWTVSDVRLDEIADGDEYDAEITSMARELRQLRALAQTQRLGPMEG
jgi:hypothetical protein